MDWPTSRATSLTRDRHRTHCAEKTDMSECTIQAPTIGRIIIFTASNTESVDGHVRTVKIDSYPGIIVRAHDGGVVDIVTFGPHSMYHNNGIPFDPHGRSGTWMYPLHTKDQIAVEFTLPSSALENNPE